MNKNCVLKRQTILWQILDDETKWYQPNNNLFADKQYIITIQSLVMDF